MTYSEITFQDKNPVERWLQRQRLVSALEAVSSRIVLRPRGAGNGELCKLLSNHYPNSHIICYEPTTDLLNEAKENLTGIPDISFIQDVGDLKRESIDLVFSLEVFEHLPQKEINSALQAICVPS